MKIGYGISLADSKQRSLAGGAVPSGLPVATTSAVVIGNISPSYFNGTYNKAINYQNGVYYDDIGTSFTKVYGLTINGNMTWATMYLFFNLDLNKWWFAYAESYGDGGFAFLSANAQNTSSDQNYIPTTGWTPAITIISA